MKDVSLATKALHAGYSPLEGGSIFPPIDMGVAFPFPDGETARRICAGEETGYTYTRTANRTNTVLEQRLAALEGGESKRKSKISVEYRKRLRSRRSGCNLFHSTHPADPRVLCVGLRRFQRLVHSLHQELALLIERLHEPAAQPDRLVGRDPPKGLRAFALQSV